MYVASEWNAYPPEYFVVIDDELDDILPSTEQIRYGSIQKQVQHLLENIQVAYENMPSKDSVRTHLSDYQSRIQDWDDHKDFLALSMESILPTGRKMIQKFMLGKNLREPSLVDLNENDVKALLESSLMQLQELLDHKMDVQWAIISSILNPENLPSKEKLSEAELSEMLCSFSHDARDTEAEIAAGTSEGASLEKTDFSLYLMEEDLEDELQAIQSILKERIGDPREYLLRKNSFVQKEVEGSKQLLKKAVTSKASQIQVAIDERIEELQRRYNSSGDDCVSKSEVLALVEEGLEALNRRQDLREVLLQKFQVLDSASGTRDELILDAVLNTNSQLPEHPIPTSINMRMIVDSPFMRHLAGYIDHTLDLISGYNDRLDHYMDHVVENVVDVNNKEVSSLGKVLVSQLLIRSGQLSVVLPRPMQTWISKQSRKQPSILSPLTY